MAFTVALRSAVTSGASNAESQTSGSATPANSSLQLVFHYNERDNHTTATNYAALVNSGTGLTWTVESTTTDSTWAGDNNYGGGGRLWSAPVTSHAAMTVTADPYTGSSQVSFQSLVWFDIIADAAFALAQAIGMTGESEGGGDSESITVSLPGAATNGNLCILIVGSSNDAAGAYTAPADWTQLVNQSTATTHIAVWYRTDFTGTSVTVTDLGQSVGHAGAVLMEFEEEGAAVVGPGFKHRPPQLLYR